MKGKGETRSRARPEGEHGTRDRLDVVLAAGDDERRHLVPDQHLVLDRDWFCTQFKRSIIL